MIRASNYTCSSEGKYNFLVLWCKDEANDKCIDIDMDFHDTYNEKLITENIKKEPKPILTTCNIESIDKRKCKTPKCSQNSDCYSGACYKKNCVAKSDIHYCDCSAGQVYCQKQMYMPCKSDEECLSSLCLDETCQPDGHRDALFKDNLGIYAYMVFVCILGVVLQFCSEKKGKRKKEKGA
ncbi:hypothetical protein BCR36DRAFT_587063 [Piromyces finnis]|uniref:Uncharacterized protein n=1 Tax=Piromyces finnis TaxID=1754191 RepID=A0A1Y1UX14_9FUNG|nr:hypothetical protein BCR36DRAFT_587063 [Piromyces finnis]|eukprot:ORX42714.1 hypothetical protein BCR36DRAFT_587063 [Piromyces finnis]